MSTINRLSSVDVLQPSDQIPVWDSSNGDTRKASMSTLLAFVESYFADPDYSTRIVAPNTDYFTVDIGNTGDSIWMIVNPILNFTTGTITLPSTAYAVNDQEITVVFTAAVINFSITSSGATVLGAPATINGYDSFRVRYNASQQTWYTLDTTGDGAGGVSQITRQDFTGDGTTTTFTLTTAPSGLGNELQIFIDGVYQERSGYAVTGSNVVFSEAPPSLSTIEVLGWSITYGAETSANLVSYTPAGTGAVVTTVQAKLRESVSVKDYGAVGDGVADDTAAFAAALVMGKAVYAPAGTYKATFTIPYGGILYGDGPAHTIITPTAGSTHAIMLDGTIVGGTQFCTVENLSIRNPNAVASCSGLKLYGLNVFDVNDNHTFSNLYISGFNYGIEILGRCIVSTFKDITTDASNTGLYVASDAANYAFNANTFTNCRFINGQAYGVYITGYAGLGLTFTGCDFEQNNLNNVVGGAGIEIENAETVTFQGCYWEANGAGIPVDAIFPANNGVDLILSGLRSYENHIDNSSFTASTTSILVTSTAAIYGGSVAGSRFQNRAGGWAVAVTGRYPDNNQPVFEINANNIFGGKIQITENGDEKNPAYLGQSDSCIFSAAATSLDLVTHKNVVFSDASPFTISTLENAYPGMELWIYNAGTGEITIAAGLAHDAAAISITAGESFSFVVSTFPLRGKLIPKTIRKEGTWTPLQGSGLTLVGAYGSAGTYIRDGSKVTIIGQISGATSVAIGGSGQMCTGLPFAAGSFGVGSTINNTLSASGACQASGSTLIASTFGASAVIYFSCTYFV